MLYDTKWDVKRPLTREHFVEWLRTKGDESFHGISNSNCAIAQYLVYCGYTDVNGTFVRFDTAQGHVQIPREIYEPVANVACHLQRTKFSEVLEFMERVP